MSVSPKSPFTVIDEIDSGELPIFRRSTVCGGLVVPTCWIEYCKRAGVTVKAGAEFGPILSTKALAVPPNVFCKAADVTGKSVENV